MLLNSLEKNIKTIQHVFPEDSTIIYKELETSAISITKCMLIYADGMVNSNIVNENIIKPLLSCTLNYENNNFVELLMKRVLLTGDNKKTSNFEDIVTGIMYGKTILFIEGSNEAICINTIGWETRSISEPQAETIVRGPREGFTESINLNLSLLRRRLVNPNLKFLFLKIGRHTKTQVCVCYINGIAREAILKELLIICLVLILFSVTYIRRYFIHKY